MSTNLRPSGNTLNNLSKSTPHRRSKFSLRPDLALTARFGDVTPFLVQNTIPGDKISTRSNISLRTYTLKSPLLQDIKMNREYFNVPMRAILPFNWDKIFVNPNIGDDVPSDAFCSVPRFQFIANFDISSLLADTGVDATNLSIFLHWYNICEQVFSSGGLCSILGLPVPHLDSFFKDHSFGNLVAECIFANTTPDTIIDFGVLNGNQEQIDVIDLTNVPAHSWYNFFSDYTLGYNTDGSHAWANQTIISDIQTFVNGLSAEIVKLRAKFGVSGSPDTTPIDLSRLWAYQMVYHHFYTNDKVDFIYSADQFRNYIGGIVQQISNGGLESFIYNGSYIPYDYLSSYYFLNFYSNYNYISYYNALFTFRRSLRYMDYFTGSRTRPLAVGNNDIPVTNGSVDVIDVTERQQYQKFRNMVNRTGRRFSKYLEVIFDSSPGYDHHDPKFLAGTQDVVYGSETENTSFQGNSDPNNVRTNLYCKSNKFAFEFEVDEPSIILGLLTFDIVRYYVDVADRQTMIKDRFDMFNPYLQYIGDQQINMAEFDKNVYDGLKPFGYATRYMEFKQAVPRAVAGFVDNLPSWLFDNRSDLVSTLGDRRFINYDFIRSSSYEIDKFYISLTGLGLNNYFHFIIKCDNYFDAVRNMAVDPQILG